VLVEEAPTTVAFTGQPALDLDEVQYKRAMVVPACRPHWRDDRDPRQPLAGLCPERGRAPQPQFAVDTAAHREDERVSGALNLYERNSGAFDEDTRSAGMAFGPYAALAAGNVRAYQSTRDRADHLEAAMQARAVIEQAKGVLSQRNKVTPDGYWLWRR
jgi:hypothetical protein